MIAHLLFASRQPNMMLSILPGELNCRVVAVVHWVSPLFFP